MLQNVKLYYRENGKLACTNVTYADNYNHAIWGGRHQILGEQEDWFEVKLPMMALVNK